LTNKHLDKSVRFRLGSFRSPPELLEVENVLRAQPNYIHPDGRVIGENEQLGASTSGKSYESERLANQRIVRFGGKASVEYFAK